MNLDMNKMLNTVAVAGLHHFHTWRKATAGTIVNL
jgi:hypothetical protein